MREFNLQMPLGSKVMDAIVSSALLSEFPRLKDQINKESTLGVWGKEATPDQMLLENDRVEIYRELRVDPKTARRERFNKQGAKMAGLFSGVRAGGKAGY